MPKIKSALSFLIVGLASLSFAATARADLQEFHFLDIIPEPHMSASLGDPVQLKGFAFRADVKALDPRLARALMRDFGKESVETPPPAGPDIVDISFKPAAELSDELCATTECDRSILAADNEAYFLETRSRDGGFQATIYADRNEGRFYGIKTLKKMAMKYGWARIDQAAVFDYPKLKIRGVLEGYYGRPWQTLDTFKTIDWMADNKFNMFIYAPKDDPKNRSNWRAPYSDTDLKRFKGYADLSKQNYSRFCWELSPGLTISYSSEEDFRALKDKFNAVMDIGVDCFILAFDDIEKHLQEADRPHFGSLAEAEATLVNNARELVAKKVPDAIFAIVPTEYWNEVLTDEYSGELGRLLHPDIFIGWTGNEISSYSIPERDANLFASFYQRKPMLGDNLPVVDTTSLNKGPIHLAPLVRRPEALADAISAFAVNAMPWVYSSWIGMATGADWAWNPRTYDPDTSIKKAIVDTVGLDAYGPFAQFVELNKGSLINHHDSQELTTLLRAFWNHFYAGDLTPVKNEFIRYFQNMASLEDPIRSKTANADLVEELSSWLRKTTAYGELGIMAADLAEKKLSGALTAEEYDAYIEQYKQSAKIPGDITRNALAPFFKELSEALRP